jgi:hypothetical protein
MAEQPTVAGIVVEPAEIPVEPSPLIARVSGASAAGGAGPQAADLPYDFRSRDRPREATRG